MGGRLNFSFGSHDQDGKEELIPPEMPKPYKHCPWIHPETSTFGSDWKKLVNRRNSAAYGDADVEFRLTSGAGQIAAHKVVLSCSSPLFRRIFQSERNCWESSPTANYRPSKMAKLFTTLGIKVDHASVFEEEEIEVDDLSDYSAEDLEKLLPKMGPRRKLMAYIESLNKLNNDLNESDLSSAPPAYDGPGDNDLNGSEEAATSSSSSSPPAYNGEEGNENGSDSNKIKTKVLSLFSIQEADAGDSLEALIKKENVEKAKAKPSSSLPGGRGNDLYAQINRGEIKGLSHIYNRKEDGKTVIMLASGIEQVTFLRVLEFLYSGTTAIQDRNDNVNELMDLARVFNFDYLVTIGQNVLDNDPDLNPSIGTYLNDLWGKVAEETFLYKPLLSDCSFVVNEDKKGSKERKKQESVNKKISAMAKTTTTTTISTSPVATSSSSSSSSSIVGGEKKEKVEMKMEKKQGQEIPGHIALISTRSDVLRDLIKNHADSSSSSSSSGVCSPIAIDGISEESFRAILQFLYSDHCWDAVSRDPYALLKAADQAGCSRIVTLCELEISKLIGAAITERVEKADIDVIGILLMAQQHNANQLAAFCLHFISTNFLAMERRPEWKMLEGNNLKYVTKNRWPPQDYLDEMAKYDKQINKGKGKTTPNGEACLLM